jgi:hypothetical protein
VAIAAAAITIATIVFIAIGKSSTLVVPGRVEGANPEPRDVPMCNCTSEVRAKRAPATSATRLQGEWCAFARQFFNRYPVLKIHHTVTMQMAKNVSVMPTLTPMPTSAIS